MICLYCKNPGPFNEEHVLSRALAGPGEDWVLKGLVCAKCNRLFSRYERAWTSEPGVALARIAMGPPGRTRQGQTFQFHPSELMFLEADGDPVSYEVDILSGITPRLRYQVIDIGAKVMPVASHQDDADRFADAWPAFIAKPEVTIQKVTSDGQTRFRVAMLNLDWAPTIVKIEWRAKPANAWWDTFGENFSRSCYPRISLDPLSRIRFRTQRLKQIPKLLGRIFATGKMTSEGKTYPTGSYHIACRGVYDIDMIHRAVAKTLVNYMVDQLGAAFASDPVFWPLLNYCIGGPDHLGSGPFVGVVNHAIGICDFDALPTNRHGLLLASDGERVVGSIKLYGNRSCYRVHLGASPYGHSFQHSTRIDYNGPGRVAA
jgi:hypothetical protein